MRNLSQYSKFFTKFSCLFLTLCLVISCSTNLQTLPVNDLKKSEALSKTDSNKTEQKPSFSIKGQKSEEKVRVTKKNKDVPIEVEVGTEKKDISNIPPPKHFSIKALSQTTFYPQEIGTEVSFDVQADYGQPWIILIQGPKTTVCNTTVTMRVRSTGPISFTLFIPATFPLSGDYNVFIGDRDPYTNAMLNSTYLGNLKINNPRGLTLTKLSESDTQLLLNFSNQTGDLFNYELLGPSTGSTSCLYYSNGTIILDKTLLAAGDYTAKISLMQYPDVSASYNFNVIKFTIVNPEPLTHRLSPSFDMVPSDSIQTEPGKISVIYHNANQIEVPQGGFQVTAVKQPDNNNGHGNDSGKCDPSNPGKSKPDCIRNGKVVLSALDPNDAKALNAILQKYQIISASDLTLPGEIKTDILLEQTKLSEFAEGEVPNRLSVHFYTFPVTVDTKAIATELRQLPFVRTAYPSVQIFSAAGFNLKGQTTINDDVAYNGTVITGTRMPPNLPPSSTSNRHPIDSYFSKPEKDTWWWFNRHKVFQAWDVYANHFGYTDISDPNLPKPKIAIIDSGFDISNTHDRPEYEGGVVIENDPSDPKKLKITEVLPDLSNISILEQTLADFDGSHNESHGAFVSSVAASPINGTNLCGIIPGAKILPIKLRQPLSNSEQKFSQAILYAGKQTAVDSINLNYVLNDRPISYIPTIGFMMFLTSFFGNKPVVIAAGNNYQNLDIPAPCTNYPACVDWGQITVGGSARDSGKQWKNTSTFGTNYGLTVDLAAAADQVSGTTYTLASASPTNYVTDPGFGTSLAAPMVASTLAMMSKLNLEGYGRLYYVYLLKKMLIYSSTLSFTEDGIISGPIYLGADLNNFDKNNGGVVRMRELNVYNALVLAENLSYLSGGPNNANPYMVRIFNTEGQTKAALNKDFTNKLFATEGDENDTMLSHDDSLTDTDSITFKTNIHNSNGLPKLPTYGYQVYNFKNLSFSERLLGVTAKYGAYIPNYISNPLHKSITKAGITPNSFGDIKETDPFNFGNICCDIKLK